ncbi:MAG: hypothetical protein L3J74_03580 [Bacteroidales bacterium]|nr:hypothetical protein [Bacteroidales bacterium]
MKILSFLLMLLFVFTSCNHNKITVYAWMSGNNKTTDKQYRKILKKYKHKGIDGVLFNGGHNPEIYHRVGSIAKGKGLAFEAWIPTMVQNPQRTGLDSTLYVVNGLGESAYNKPAYVPHYTFLCPNHEEVYTFLKNMYVKVARVPEVDAIHLDYIRFPDVILARGLWKKYNLVMDKEYPQFDYCYCDKCVEDFKNKSGIDIKSVDEPSKVEEWKQYRYDLITNLVNRLVEDIHAENKKISAAVFPGPSIAKKIVRQEWNKWKLDAFYPMLYNDFYWEDTKWIGAMCKEGSSIIGDTPLYSGLFINPKPENKTTEPDPENLGLTPDELGDAIQESMENGAAGICLFTPQRMTKAHWKVFKKAIRENYK